MIVGWQAENISISRLVFPPKITWLIWALGVGCCGLTPIGAQDQESLWSGSRKGEVAVVKAALAAGVDVNATTAYGATALAFAADRGHLNIVKLLIDKKADPNRKDDFYGAVPMDWAGMRGHYQIMKALVAGGASQLQPVLAEAITQKDQEFLRSIANHPQLTYRLVKNSLELAKTEQYEQGIKILEPLLEKLAPAEVLVPSEFAKRCVGAYLLGESTLVTIGQNDHFLTAKLGAGNAFELDYLDNAAFNGNGMRFEFVEKDGQIQGLNWSQNDQSQFLKRISKEEAAKIESANPIENNDPLNPRFARSSELSRAQDLKVSSSNWPQFRGNQARGIADGQNPPVYWNVEENLNLAWSVELTGLGHSCPVIWENRLFVTTAIGEKEASLKTGLYGDVDSVKDNSEHEFFTYCFDKQSGKLIWKQMARKSVPKVKRHLKSTHANSTVATDGHFVVAWFASEGVYIYSMDGQLIWHKDLGLLDSGWFYDRDYQWQFGASPIICDGKLILLCDIQDQSFIGCYSLATGKELWVTRRDEIPSWSTPTVIDTPTGKIVVTNATKAARGYDLNTGKELWQIANNSEIAVPTPFAARNLIFVCSGYRPIQPIYAIRMDARGDLTLSGSEKKSEYIAWSDARGGPYMPTPIVYGDYLYVCSNSGILACYQATTGEQVYKKRLRMKGTRSFVGSPVAADGYLYLTSEDGETAVVRAGPEFKLVANNASGKTCLATPAISDGRFFLRTQNHLFAFEDRSASREKKKSKK